MDAFTRGSSFMVNKLILRILSFFTDGVQVDRSLVCSIIRSAEKEAHHNSAEILRSNPFLHE